MTRKALIVRAGKQFGNQPVVVSLPIVFGYAVAFVLENLSPNPPVTRTMLGVLDHDDVVDTRAATDLLGITLTPVDEMLKNVLRNY